MKMISADNRLRACCWGQAGRWLQAPQGLPGEREKGFDSTEGRAVVGVTTGCCRAQRGSPASSGQEGNGGIKNTWNRSGVQSSFCWHFPWDPARPPEGGVSKQSP